MVMALVVVVAFGVGYGVCWWARRDEALWLRRELRVAQDRLYGAWQDRALIPARGDEPVVRDRVPALPDELRALVADWESPETRLEVEERVRGLHFGQGLSVSAVVRKLGGS